MHLSSAYCRRNDPMPVRNHADAVRLISAAVHEPLEHQTLGVLLDRHGRGRENAIIDVSGTVEPEAMLRVTNFMSMLGERSHPFTRLVVATVRPNGGLLAEDVDRWLEASQIAEGYGVRLIEWYVVHPDGISRPRELLGEPPRW